MIVLDGKIAAQAIKDQIRSATEKIAASGNRPPHLAAILVGTNGASETYVASKVKNCQETGIQSTLIRLDDQIAQSELLLEIEKLNQNPSIDGILVQLPLPKHISEAAVIEAIHPDKDVDGFHPINAGKLVQGLPTFIPATPYGILLMLEHFQLTTKGKHAVVIGRSNIVGRPMSILLSSNIPFGNCTVTLCHSHTPNLNEICRQADIIVAALGKPEFVTANMIKPGAIVIDVGITRVADATAKNGFRIKGDVAYASVAPLCEAITPVPGGVGLMTIAGLLKNTLQAYYQHQH
ncbi:MAG: bifunctional 5,10-methylenetetrahydrofolate dehydrogenase/5,10-methenyltetrahydrofolate cyclohydrolase [Chitinophagia bacterium]|nr:bifunctional 5,10-methylenetetrahydrofolate dehydrogenase/5,10-methenyltetrahydrofolate cyclohydrolase [Chitinophagia bacterium]